MAEIDPAHVTVDDLIAFRGHANAFQGFRDSVGKLSSQSRLTFFIQGDSCEDLPSSKSGEDYSFHF